MKGTIELIALMALGSVTPLNSTRAQSDASEKEIVDYSIDVTVEGLNNDTVYLAHYYGNKLYYSDTTVTDGLGNLSFSGRPYERCGKHAIVIPGPKYFEFMAVTEDVKIRTKASDPSRFVEVLESEENRIFYDFLGFIQDRRKLAIPHESVLGDSTATKEALDAARQVLTSLGEQVGLEQKRILKEYPEYLFAKYLNMVIEPEIPEVPGNIVNEQDLQYR